MNMIKVDTDKCTNCKNCYKACFVDVIRWDEELELPIIAYPEDCVDCLYCETSCNDDAIHVIIDFKKPIAPAY
ncbi:MAG: hypothetical protein K0S80_1480 [Neobacillus sp.]|jgi:NAD-dependent dihydropyrimidine dehydrogenase PreA subunit|nr:hypothetical protein [Neobacillus sp.]